MKIFKRSCEAESNDHDKFHYLITEITNQFKPILISIITKYSKRLIYLAATLKSEIQILTT